MENILSILSQNKRFELVVSSVQYGTNPKILKSENSDSDTVEIFLMFLFILGYVALGISLLYIALQVKISRDAKLDLDISILGTESLRNLVQD